MGMSLCFLVLTIPAEQLAVTFCSAHVVCDPLFCPSLAFPVGLIWHHFISEKRIHLSCQSALTDCVYVGDFAAMCRRGILIL